jgi:hypothetical protein
VGRSGDFVSYNGISLLERGGRLRRVRHSCCEGLEKKMGNLRVAFLHPDLGIGGAERLVVDAAVGLQQRGHSVRIYTAHHAMDHCFEETRNGAI